MKPTLQSNTTASLQFISPVGIEITVLRPRNRGTIIKKEKVAATSKSTSCANPVVAQDEFSSELFERYSDFCVQAPAKRSGNHRLLKKFPHENNQDELNHNTFSEGVEDPFIECNLSSGDENSHICNEKSIPSVVNDNANEGTAITPQKRSSEKNENVDPDNDSIKYFDQETLSVPYYGIEEIDPIFIDGFWYRHVSCPNDLAIFGGEPTWYKRLLDIPIRLLGTILGRNNKNLNYLSEAYGAKLVFHKTTPKPSSVCLEVHCPTEFKEDFIKWLLERIRTKPSNSIIGNPERLLRIPRLGKLARVLIRSSYFRKHLFVTIFDKKYEAFVEMEKKMTADYSSIISKESFLPEPICARTISVLKMGTNCYRVLIVHAVSEDNNLIICFLLDHGIFAVVNAKCLYKIKMRYMKVPFQAVSVTWAHARSSFVEVSDAKFLTRYFKAPEMYIFPVRNETCRRPAVVFFEKQGRRYQDILDKANRNGECAFSEEVIKLDDQFELNRTTTAYYYCSYVPKYQSLVSFLKPNGMLVKASDEPKPQPSQELSSQQQNQSKQQREEGRKPGNQQNFQDGTHNGGAAATTSKPQNKYNHKGMGGKVV
nr:hypothetical protein HmN_000234000 [Hymenolepis microstoma]